MSQLQAPAKLTVSLKVVGRRSDGYHLLDAEMVSIDLVDTLTFVQPLNPEPAPEDASIEASSGAATVAGVEVVPPSREGERYRVPTGVENLVTKALQAVGREAHVRLEKRIPPGGGLGGGSTDAAAVLRWAGRANDVALAASLGADVPFCLKGGRAHVGGIGEQVTPLPFVARTFTLLIPPFGCSTPAVYRAYDELADRGRQGTSPAANDLQAAALAVEPRLAAWRDELAHATGHEPVLAGSGSTWFVEGDFPGDDRIVVHTLASYAP